MSFFFDIINQPRVAVFFSSSSKICFSHGLGVLFRMVIPSQVLVYSSYCFLVSPDGGCFVLVYCLSLFFQP